MCLASGFLAVKNSRTQRTENIMQKTLPISAICLSFGLVVPAFAQDTNNSDHSNQHNNSSQHNDSSTGADRGNMDDAYSDGTGSAAANNGGTSTSSFASSFNTSKAVAISRLDGSVSDISGADSATWPPTSAIRMAAKAVRVAMAPTLHRLGIDIQPGQTLEDIERRAIMLTLDHFGRTVHALPMRWGSASRPSTTSWRAIAPMALPVQPDRWWCVRK
jgi:hypothetical protein